MQANAEMTLPVETSAAPLRLAVNRTRPMSGEVSLSGQIQPIWDIFLGGEQRLAGQVEGQAAIAGSINDPRITGSLDVRQGSFRDTITGVRLEALTLAARFDGESAQVQTFTANDGSGGTVSGSGRMNLRQGSSSSFTLTLSSFRLIDNEIATADASGPVTVTRGADGNIQLMGRLNIDEAEIAANPVGGNGIVRMDVIEVNRPGGDPVANGQDDPEADRRGPTIGLDIVLRSPNGHVWVRGRGLNVEMNVNARVRGTLASPQLTGTARVVRGDYDFAGKRFVFDERGTVTLSTDVNRIRLDLRAVREDPALTAEVRVTGTAASPEIELTSTPQLPQDEILSQVLFGRSASQLSAFEAAQLASGVASLAGGGGFDVLGNLREFAGLDRLSFGGDASALTVAGGRYLTDNVYLEVIGGGEGGGGGPGGMAGAAQHRRHLPVRGRRRRPAGRSLAESDAAARHGTAGYAPEPDGLGSPTRHGHPAWHLSRRARRVRAHEDSPPRSGRPRPRRRGRRAPPVARRRLERNQLRQPQRRGPGAHAGRAGGRGPDPARRSRAHPHLPSSIVGDDGRVIEQAHADCLKITARPDAPIQVVLTGHYDTVFPADSRLPDRRPRAPTAP